MNLKTKNITKLLFGILLYAVGIIFTINANLGVAPWDAFHQGVSINLNVTFGVASMAVGFFIVIINYLLGERIGVGTILNIFGIGLVIDFIFATNIIPVASTFFGGVLMILTGIIAITFATFFYISAGYGTGPRDGLMVALLKRTGKRIGVIRACIEISALTIGFFMGGQIGFGTVILGVFVGPIMQFIFKVLKFDVKSVEHKYIIGRNLELSVSEE